MCGITGYISNCHYVDVHRFYAAHLQLAHRGPDDEGFLVIENDNGPAFYRGDDTINDFSIQKHILSVSKAKIILGHRRLSIIDLSPAGHQPMEFDGLYLVYNGEIYNYLELRDDLKQKGYEFLTNSDTEVFLKAYHAWGIDAFNKFNGMWSAAIYDINQKQLVLTRDRFGIKPLYYSYLNNCLYFASEAKFIRSLIHSLTLNYELVNEYLKHCKLDYSTDTFYKEIKELEPGHYLIFELISSNFTIKKYWDVTNISQQNIEYETAKKILSQLFDQSLDLRLRSDVPVGSLLSGGLDSNAIVCNLQYRHKVITFQTFSAVFYEKKYSEKDYINATLQKYPRIQGYSVYPSPFKLYDDLEMIFYYQEFPFRSLSVYSQFVLYNFIKDHTKVKVILNGQGSDEIFAGYSYHYFFLFCEKLKFIQIDSLYREIKKLSVYRNYSLSTIIYYLIRYFVRELFKTHTVQSLNNILLKELNAPLREYLRYEDRNSMMASIETRLPFLDYRLVKYVLSLPSTYKIYDGINKRILRDNVKEYVPERIVNRKDKMGFVSPQEEWQKNVLKDLILSFNYPKKHRGFIMKYYQGQHNDWPKVWRIFCLTYWLEHIFKGTGDS
jgi:asparagine synthase (glutamine-hydrolysing)